MLVCAEGREEGGHYICNDIDPAELLHEHDEETALRSSSVPFHHEELFEKVLAFALCGFNFQHFVRVVHIPCSLEFMLAQTGESVESLVVAALLHVPARGLWAEINLSHDEHWWYCC